MKRERNEGKRLLDKIPCWLLYSKGKVRSGTGVHQELVERSSGIVPGYRDKLDLSIIDAANRKQEDPF